MLMLKRCVRLSVCRQPIRSRT